MPILITAPSLDETRNVSGISTVVRQMIECGPAGRYDHFMVGRADGESKRAAWLLRQAALPISFFRRAVDRSVELVHINTALTGLAIWRDAALAAAARLAGRRIVLSIHGGRYLVEEIRDPLTRTAASALLRSAASVIVLSENERSLLAERWPELKLRVLPNAVALPHRTRAARPVGERPVIVFLGRMHESKGLRELVAAARELANRGIDFEFRAYGEGHLREWFVDEMTALLGPRFLYGGVAVGGDKWRVLAEADIFVLPSLYGEGLPMAMLEAMATALVVVVSEMASVGTVIDDGVNGFLVRPGDTLQLVDTLRRVIGTRDRWEAVGSAARATVERRFSIGPYLTELENIYREAIGKN
ncbi:MAG: glycosyltransferase family 4 protein [Pyrinomonadaceae bacterium]